MVFFKLPRARESHSVVPTIDKCSCLHMYLHVLKRYKAHARLFLGYIQIYKAVERKYRRLLSNFPSHSNPMRVTRFAGEGLILKAALFAVSIYVYRPVTIFPLRLIRNRILFALSVPRIELGKVVSRCHNIALETRHSPSSRLILMEPYLSPDPSLPSLAQVLSKKDCAVGESGHRHRGSHCPTMSASQAISRSPYRSPYSAARPPRPMRGDGHRQDSASRSGRGGRFLGNHQPYNREYRSSPYSLHTNSTGGMGGGHNVGTIRPFDPAQAYVSGRLGLPDVPSHHGRYGDHSFALGHRDGHDGSPEGARILLAASKGPFHTALGRPVPTEATNTKGFRPFGSSTPAALKRNQSPGEATGTYPINDRMQFYCRPNPPPPPSTANTTMSEIQQYPHYNPRCPTVTVPSTVSVPPRILESSFSGYALVPAPAPHRASLEGRVRPLQPEDDMPPLPALPTAVPPPQEMQQDHHHHQQEEGEQPEQEKDEDQQEPPVEMQKDQPQQNQEQTLKLPVVSATSCNETFAPMPLGIPSDSKYLTEFHCFLRRNLIEVFCANHDDINGTFLVLMLQMI